MKTGSVRTWLLLTTQQGNKVLHATQQTRRISTHMRPWCLPAVLALHATESREESLLLANQLAAARSDLQKAKASAGKLSRQLETEQLLRTDAEGAAEALKQRLERLLGSSNEVNKQRTDLAEVRCAGDGW